MGDGEVVSYCQPMHQTWAIYESYAFKTDSKQLSTDEQIEKTLRETYQKCREKKSNQFSLQFYQDQLVKLVGITQFHRRYKKISETFYEHPLLTTEDDSDEDMPSAGAIDLHALDIDNVVFTAKQISMAVLKQVCHFTRVVELHTALDLDDACGVACIALLSSIIDRPSNDTDTRGLYLYGRAGIGKSFLFNQQVNSGYLTQVPTDADGVGRYRQSTTSRGFLLDDVGPDFLNKPTNNGVIKQLCVGANPSVKIHSTTTTAFGYVNITSNHPPNSSEWPVDELQAWTRRLIFVKFGVPRRVEGVDVDFLDQPIVSYTSDAAQKTIAALCATFCRMSKYSPNKTICDKLTTAVSADITGPIHDIVFHGGRYDDVVDLILSK